jgi:hypothetical protein
VGIAAMPPDDAVGPWCDVAGWIEGAGRQMPYGMFYRFW